MGKKTHLNITDCIAQALKEDGVIIDHDDL